MHIVVCIKQVPDFGGLVSSSSGSRQLTATRPRSDRHWKEAVPPAIDLNSEGIWNGLLHHLHQTSAPSRHDGEYRHALRRRNLQCHAASAEAISEDGITNVQCPTYGTIAAMAFQYQNKST